MRNAVKENDNSRIPNQTYTSQNAVADTPLVTSHTVASFP